MVLKYKIPCLKINHSSSVLDDVSSWNTPRLWWNKWKCGSMHSVGSLGQNKHSYLDYRRFWFLEQYLHVLAAFCFFFCWWYSREVMKRYLQLQMAVSRRRTNQICYYRFSKIFHVLCNGVSCAFNIHIIRLAEKDFHDVNPNFLVPPYSFPTCRVIQQYLIWFVDMSNIWFPFRFALPVDWIHHCWHVSIADDTNIPFIFPISNRNVTKGHENNFTFSKLLSNYLRWFSLSISMQGASTICVSLWHVLYE